MARGTDWQLWGLLIVTAGLYWPTTSPLWHRPVFGGNGLLVLVLSVWLLVYARERVAQQPVKGMPWALVLLVPCSIMTFVIWKSAVPPLQLLLVLDLKSKG